MRGSHLRSVGFLALALLVVSLAPDSTNAQIQDERLRGEVSRSIDRGLKWLRGQQQDNGSWEHHVGITGLVLTGYARSPRAYREEDGPFIRGAAEFLDHQESLSSDSNRLEDIVLPTAVTYSLSHNVRPKTHCIGWGSDQDWREFAKHSPQAVCDEFRQHFCWH